jgi:hypothetical protein
MARKRTRNYDDSNVRFGRGGSFAEGSDVVRIGTKDPRQKRDKMLNFRVTPLEDEAIRAAFAASGAESFTHFAATALMDGIESRSAGVAWLEAGSSPAIGARDELREEVTEKLGAAAGAAEQMSDVLSDVFKRQEALGRVSVANARNVAAMAEAVSSLTIAVSGIGEKLDALFHRIGVERGEVPEGGRKNAPRYGHQS